MLQCVTVISLCVAISLAVFSRGHSSPLDLKPPSPMHRLEVEGDYDIKAVISNRSSTVVRLVGAGNFCGSRGCVSVNCLPVLIPAGEEFSLPIHFQAGIPGSFLHELPIYTDSLAQPYLIIPIRGEVADRKAVPEAAGPN